MLVEPLEQRIVRSATVVEGYPGFYEVRGGPGDDWIHITVDMDARTFALDGQTYSNVNFISVWGYEGNDDIHVSTSSGYATISAALHGGRGDDQLWLNFDGAVWGDEENDTISVSDAFRGQVYGGPGNDVAYLSGENIEAVVYGDTGDDILHAGSNHHGIEIYGGIGNDFLYGSPHADYLDGGQGRDTIHGGGGNDTMFGGNGDDQFHTGYHYAEIYVAGGDGYDEVYRYTGLLTLAGVEQLYIL